jgi:mannose-6-phosphate isomerase-like protein (cupin superfamily)
VRPLSRGKANLQHPTFLRPPSALLRAGEENEETRWQRLQHFQQPRVSFQSPCSLNAQMFVSGPTPISIVLKGTDTDDKFSFIDMLIPPGGGPMPHAHECEEMFYVVEGEVAVFCHDRRTLGTTAVDRGRGRRVSSRISYDGWKNPLRAWTVNFLSLAFSSSL